MITSMFWDEFREGIGVFLGESDFWAVFLVSSGFEGFCLRVRFSETLKALLGLGLNELVFGYLLSAKAGNDRLSGGSRN